MKRFLYLCLGFILAIPASAQWKHVGPWQGDVTGAITYNGRTYISTNSGVIYETTDEGKTYVERMKGVSTQGTRNCTGFLTYKGELWAVMTGDLPYVLDTVASLWRERDHAGFASYSVMLATADVMYATGGIGVYRSTDGYEWSFDKLDGRSFISAFHEIGNRILAVAQKGVFVSMDKGITWVFQGLPVDGSTITASTIFNGKILMALSAGGVLSSADNGATWTKTTDGLPAVGPKQLLVVNDRCLALVDGDGMYGCSKSGEWRKITGDRSLASASGLAAVDGLLFAGTAFDGIMASTDEGVTWKETTTGLRSYAFYGHVADSDGVWGFINVDAFIGAELAMMNPKTGKKRSIPEAQNVAARTTYTGALSASENVLTMAYSQYVPDTMAYAFSIATYDKTTGEWSNMEVDTVAFAVNRTRYTGIHRNGDAIATMTEDGSFFFSSDAGRSWSQTRSGFAEYAKLTGNGNLLVASGPNIVTSRNGGARWKPFPDLNSIGTSVAVVDDLIILVTYSPATVMISSDSGQTFTTVKGLPPGYFADMVRTGDTYVYCTSDKGLYTLAGSPGNFRYAKMDDPPETTKALFVCGDYLVAATTKGYYTRPLSSVSTVAETRHEDDLQVMITPSPATSHLNVTVPAGTNRWSIYDVNGAELMNGLLKTDASTIRIDLSTVSTGVYLFKAETGGRQASGRFSVVR